MHGQYNQTADEIATWWAAAVRQAASSVPVTTASPPKVLHVGQRSRVVLSLEKTDVLKVEMATEAVPIEHRKAVGQAMLRFNHPHIVPTTRALVVEIQPVPLAGVLREEPVFVSVQPYYGLVCRFRSASLTLQPLWSYVMQHGALSSRQTARLLFEVISPLLDLHHLHDMRHGDIQPMNILCKAASAAAAPDRGPTFALTDMGSATWLRVEHGDKSSVVDAGGWTGHAPGRHDHPDLVEQSELFWVGAVSVIAFAGLMDKWPKIDFDRAALTVCGSCLSVLWC